MPGTRPVERCATILTSPRVSRFTLARGTCSSSTTRHSRRGSQPRRGEHGKRRRSGTGQSRGGRTCLIVAEAPPGALDRLLLPGRQGAGLALPQRCARRPGSGRPTRWRTKPSWLTRLKGRGSSGRAPQGPSSILWGGPAAHKPFGLKVGAGTRRSPRQRPRPRDPAPCRRRSCTRPCRRLRRRGRAAPWASAAS